MTFSGCDGLVVSLLRSASVRIRAFFFRHLVQNLVLFVDVSRSFLPVEGVADGAKGQQDVSQTLKLHACCIASMGAPQSLSNTEFEIGPGAIFSALHIGSEFFVRAKGRFLSLGSWCCWLWHCRWKRHVAHSTSRSVAWRKKNSTASMDTLLMAAEAAWIVLNILVLLVVQMYEVWSMKTIRLFKQ